MAADDPCKTGTLLPPLFASLSRGYHAVYIDHSAVTGRATREFALALLQLSIPRPAAVYLCPIVDRLSPSEDEILRAVRELSQEGQTIRFVFSSLLQLRIRSFNIPESTTLYAGLRHIVETATSIPDAPSREWGDSLKERIDELGRHGQRPMQCPLFTAPVDEITASIDTVYLRHLISLYEQGIPVLTEMSRILHLVLRDDAATVLLVFAVEPDLLDNPLIHRSFSRDITELSLRTLESNPHIGLKSNALWILSLQRHPLERYGRQIAKLCARDPRLRSQWLVHVLSEENREIRRGATSAAESAVAEMMESCSGDEREQLALLVDCLQTRHYQPRHRPLTEGTAKQILHRLLESMRGHGEGGYNAWTRITVDTRAIEADADFAKRAPLSEERATENWPGARTFLDETVLPALHAMLVLSRRNRFEYISLLTVAVRELPRAFETAYRTAMEVSSGKQEASAFVLAWADVSKWSFTERPDMLLTGLCAGTVAKTDRTVASVIDQVLPDLVADPLGLLLNALQAEFGAGATCRVMQEGVDAPDSLSIRSQLDLLRPRWSKGGAIPLFWENPAFLRNIYRILAGNIRKHGDYPSGVTVETAVTSQNRYRVQIRNKSKRNRPPGLGEGNMEVETLTRRISATFEHAEVGDEYIVTHTVPVEILSLPRVGGGAI